MSEVAPENPGWARYWTSRFHNRAQGSRRSTLAGTARERGQERPRNDSNIRHMVPETNALSPELRGRDAARIASNVPRQRKRATNAARHSNGSAGTIDRSWPIRSSPSPTCWRRRSRRSPVVTARRPGGASQRPRTRPGQRGAGARQAARPQALVTWPTTSSPRPISTGRPRSRSQGPGSSTSRSATRSWPNSCRHSTPTIASVCSAPATTERRRRRLLGAQRRQGDARRPPAHHRHRRRAGAHDGVPAGTASFARTTSATGARRSACSSSTWSTRSRPRRHRARGQRPRRRSTSRLGSSSMPATSSRSAPATGSSSCRAATTRRRPTLWKRWSSSRPGTSTSSTASSACC